MSLADLVTVADAASGPWLAACDRFDAQPRSADLAILAVLLLAVSVTESLHGRRSR